MYGVIHASARVCAQRVRVFKDTYMICAIYAPERKQGQIVRRCGDDDDDARAVRPVCNLFSAAVYVYVCLLFGLSLLRLCQRVYERVFLSLGVVMWLRVVRDSYFPLAIGCA